MASAARLATNGSGATLSTARKVSKTAHAPHPPSQSDSGSGDRGADSGPAATSHLGAKKLLAIVEKRHPGWVFPGRSTVCEILNRHGRYPRRRRVIGHPGKPTAQMLAPTTSGAPTSGPVQDRRRHLLLSAHRDRRLQPLPAGLPGLLSTSAVDAKPVFTRLFIGIRAAHPNTQR